jgi:hypothetical protein
MHSPDCTGCPHCSAELAQLVRDASARRFAAVAATLRTMQERVFRAVRGSQPAAKPVQAPAQINTVPPAPSLVEAIKAARAKGPQRKR